ncbi:tetratricopeptide repeat protein [Chryseobacterium sp. Tr-659]|uniref:tetratricopeptide repeat protein n=1 Tax=Chryseobacterium sp. Tr-659 TaxID=2608340 RepID=UPI00141F071A|nr:tetratricopeptide repeat protein [Chryseobacterium sp. Tr-659]NIF07520.1 tetratricopeptide repeat protein [Chryseobacterium sp. Tr-659]
MKKILQIAIGIVALGLIIVIAKNALFTDGDTQFYNDGWAAHEKGQYELATFYFKRVNKTEYPDIPMALGSSYLELKDYGNAITNFQEAYKNRKLYSNEDFSKILNSLGYCYLQTGDLNNARYFLQEAEKSGNPNSKRNLQIVDSLEQKKK